jgi:DNA-binding response OmpR family regulator
VLIVEDDPLIAMDLEEMAIRSGWRVVGPANDLEAAVEAATYEDIDYALLDFNLGGGTNTIPDAETLTNRKLEYCFISASDPREARAVNPRARFAMKPVSLFELRQILDAVRPMTE